MPRLRREAGLPAFFPGGDPFVFEMVDTDLLAGAFEWAADASTARNEDLQYQPMAMSSSGRNSGQRSGCLWDERRSA